jgi:hypothetical protein
MEIGWVLKLWYYFKACITVPQTVPRNMTSYRSSWPLILRLLIERKINLLVQTLQKILLDKRHYITQLTLFRLICLLAFPIPRPLEVWLALNVRQNHPLGKRIRVFLVLHIPPKPCVPVFALSVFARPVLLQWTVLVPAMYDAAMIYDGVDVFVCQANFLDGLPIIYVVFLVVYFDVFVAWQTRVGAEQVIKSAERVDETACAPSEVELGVCMNWVSSGWVKFTCLFIKERYSGPLWEVKFDALPGSLVMIGAGKSDTK